MIAGVPEPSYLPLVAQLASFEPPVFVFGGIAEDALLDGSITRPHGDVDVLGARATLDRHLEDLRSIGFDGFEVFFESPPGMPLVLGAERDGLSVEIGVFDELEPGIASFVLPVSDGLVRISLPADSLHHPLASIDGVPIRTVSPLALYQLREAFTLTGVFGPARDKDRAAQARLRQELLADTAEADLRPLMVPVTDS
jgi:hypothetical protein